MEERLVACDVSDIERDKFSGGLGQFGYTIMQEIP
jgi:hypothetical protein